MEYHEIGEIFERDGVLLEVVPSPIYKFDACSHCYFHNNCTHDDIKCTWSTRKDNTNIVFKCIEASDIREIREKAIFGSIDTFFTDIELKILKMIDKQKEKRSMEQKPKEYIEEVNKEIAEFIKEESDKCGTQPDGIKTIPKRRIVYKEILDKLFETYKAKDRDYGSAFSEMFDELGIDYAYGKLREKINRIKVLRNQPNMVENESLEDALLDTAGYAILTLVELKKRSNGVDK